MRSEIIHAQCVYLNCEEKKKLQNNSIFKMILLYLIFSNSSKTLLDKEKISFPLTRVHLIGLLNFELAIFCQNIQIGN